MRQEYAPNGKAPREYPPDIIDAVLSLYQSGMTRAEVQEAIGPGVKAEVVLRRYGALRRAIKRDQRRERNASWRGSAATYKAFHLRVATERGKPSLCGFCGTTEGKFEWANLTRNYQDVNDYVRLCVPCHRKFDAWRRKEVMPHV